MKSGLASLKELSQEHEFEAVVAIWPYFSPEGIVDLESRNIEKREDFEVVRSDRALAIEELARDQGLPTFRLSKFFREHSAVDPAEARSYYTVDGMHATKEGCEMAARALQFLLDSHPEYLGSTQK